MISFFRVFAALFIFATLALIAQPKLEIVGGDACDWKDVKPKDTPLTKDVVLKNAGDKKLVITKVKPTCGCTTAPLDKKELMPGGTATMKVRLNIGSRAGALHKSIYISSNDPENGRRVLHLKANVVCEIEISPRHYLTFEQMSVGVEKTARVFIKNNSKRDVSLSEITITPKSMSINLTKDFVLKPGERVEVVARATPEKIGYYSGSVVIKTDHPDYESLKIQGYGNVKESPIFNN